MPTTSTAGCEDPGIHLGPGKVEELAALVAQRDARTVVVDGELTPSQNHALRKAMPDGTELFDRYRLVLRMFGERATTRRAQLQVELARLRYDLPRMREAADEGWFSRRAEKGSPLYDVPDRIDGLQYKLDDLRSAVRDGLPTDRAELRLPNLDGAMGVVSWLHDHATVEGVEYGAGSVRVVARGRPAVLERARGKVEAVAGESGPS